jgi:hypothetical protein
VLPPRDSRERSTLAEFHRKFAEQSDAPLGSATNTPSKRANVARDSRILRGFGRSQSLTRVTPYAVVCAPCAIAIWSSRPSTHEFLRSHCDRNRARRGGGTSLRTPSGSCSMAACELIRSNNPLNRKSIAPISCPIERVSSSAVHILVGYPEVIARSGSPGITSEFVVAVLGFSFLLISQCRLPCSAAQLRSNSTPHLRSIEFA